MTRSTRANWSESTAKRKRNTFESRSVEWLAEQTSAWVNRMVAAKARRKATADLKAKATARQKALHPKQIENNMERRTREIVVKAGLNAWSNAKAMMSERQASLDMEYDYALTLAMRRIRETDWMRQADRESQDVEAYVEWEERVRVFETDRMDDEDFDAKGAERFLAVKAEPDASDTELETEVDASETECDEDV